MAKQVQELWIDDIDGSEAETTVSFAVDGQAYEFDASTANAEKFYETLAFYVEHSRKVTAAKPKVKRARRQVAAAPEATPSTNGHGDLAMTPELRAEMRRWLQSKGYKVGDRGRLPAAGIEDYRQAHGL